MQLTIKSNMRLLLMIFMLLGFSELSAQIIMNPPEPYDPPGGGNTAFTAICAGLDEGSGPFNSYDIEVSWAGSLPNSNNVFILELSDANGSFDNPIELARTSTENANTAKKFVQNFSIPTNLRGNNFKFRSRSTNPETEAISTNTYDVYYMSITNTGLNISELGDGNPPGSICSADPVTLQVDNITNPESYKYRWTRSGTALSETSYRITADTSGSYQVQIDYGSCSNNANTDSNFVNVTIGASGTGVNIVTPSNTSLCAGQTVDLRVEMPDNSASYQWFKGATAVGTGTSYTVDGGMPGFEGSYTVEISGTGACTERSAPVNITSGGSFNVTRTNPENVVVFSSQSQTLSVSTNATSPTYEWFRNGTSIGNNSASLEITQAGTYYAQVTSGGACVLTINSESTNAVTPSSFEIKIDYDGNYVPCENTSIALEISEINAIGDDGSKTNVTAQLEDSFNYQWKLNGNNVEGATDENITISDATAEGSYTVDGSLDTYNASSNALSVKLLTSETVSITSTGTIFCSSEEALTISTDTDLSTETFSWFKDGERLDVTTETLVVNGVGTYQLVLDKNGCDLRSNEIIISGLDPDLISLDVEGDIIFPKGGSITVTATGGTSYIWADADGNVLSTTDSMQFTEEGTFTLTANIDNCQITKELTAMYLDTFKVPNVITPNGDGSNDQWVIPNSYSNKADVNVIIYTQNGVELMNETSYQNNWPGASVSFPKQNMVFYYVIKNATETLKQGTITVIR